jgi:DNA-binding IclR family transcriptional regulator
VNVKQAANVLDLLEFFAQHQQPASLAELARALGWPRSSAFNLLGTLAARGFLYEPRARGGYYPTPLWTALLRRIDSADPLPEQLHALLQALVSETNETAVVAAVSGPNALFVDAIESPQALRYAAQPGKVVPLHVTATGRALLSMMAPTDRALVLKKAVFERYTPTTLTSAEAVEQVIRQSAKRGWFEGRAEYSADLGGVALPLRLPHRDLALLVAGPTSRVQPRISALVAVMRREIARHITPAEPG